jgi:hypothetical protein
MSDAGGVLYDRDAVYVEIPDWKVRLIFAHFPNCVAAFHAYL